MADMLSRETFKNESDMVSEDEDVVLDFFKTARLSVEDKHTQILHAFNKNEYEGEWLLIGRLLRTLMSDISLMKEEALRIRKKAYRYFVKGGFLWRHPKRRTRIPRRVVVKKEEQVMLMTKLHESAWASHRGTWATFEKLKEKY